MAGDGAGGPIYTGLENTFGEHSMNTTIAPALSIRSRPFQSEEDFWEHSQHFG